jgi:LuxR family transcriptional regulator, maltose regulon positive regulatory protein
MDVSFPAILHTKVSLPSARAEVVSRPRLIAQFNTGRTRPLTLICAPAGFGKTTLVSEWHHSNDGHDVPLAWLSLDEDDNDLIRFLSYILAALDVAIPGIDAGIFTLFQSSQAPPGQSHLDINY